VATALSMRDAISDSGRLGEWRDSKVLSVILLVAPACHCLCNRFNHS
jgi:hypothetical protein